MGVVVLITLLIMHGIIHITGAIKTFTGTSTVSVTKHSSKLLKITIYSKAASIWILAALLFFVAGGLLFFNYLFWWLPGAIAVVLSQVLIVRQWKQAKYGTIINVVLLTVMVLAFARWNENRKINNELSLFANPKKSTTDTIVKLPARALPIAVQNWLTACGGIQHNTINSAIILQSGTIRKDSNSSWHAIEALSYFNTNKPAFVCISSLQNQSGKTVTGFDKYKNGVGNSRCNFMSVIRIPCYTGYVQNIDYLSRFLAHLAWFPPVALQQYILWSAIDSSKASAIINLNGQLASGTFTFNSNSELITFTETRMLRRGDNSALTPLLHVNYEDGETKEIGGMRLPAYAIFSWKTNTNLYSWCKLNVDNATFNNYYK